MDNIFEVMVPIAGMVALFGGFWMTITIVIVLRHKQTLHERQMTAELVLEMLHSKMSADEIERILLAWTQDRRRARNLLNESADFESYGHNRPVKPVA